MILEEAPKGDDFKGAKMSIDSTTVDPNGSQRIPTLRKRQVMPPDWCEFGMRNAAPCCGR